MKKIFSLIMVLVISLSLCACSKNPPTNNETKKTETLTLENIDSYLELDATKTFSNDATGYARIAVGTTNKSNVKFKDVEITVKVTALGNQVNGCNLGWEFEKDNIPSEFRDNESESPTNRYSNSKEIKIKVPYDGVVVPISELLNSVSYSEQDVPYRYDLDYFYAEIIEVSGSVEIED